jgi:DivIVA domain-containing protein
MEPPMEPQNPEERIAELERQLAEQKRMAELKRQQAGPVKRPVVSPEDVHNVAFSKPAIGQHGYNQHEVDAFLDRVEAALRDPTARAGVTPADIHNVAFPKPWGGQRGYNEGEVDAFLDRVEEQMNSQQGAFPPPPTDQLSARHATGPESRFRRIISSVIEFITEPSSGPPPLA